jgi:regulatory protein
LERKLRARGFPPGIVFATLDELERTRALDSERFVESFVRARVARGQGPVRILAELEQRGIDTAEHRSRLYDEYDWTALAGQARRKRFGPGPVADYGDRGRQARFLQYRGFDSEQTRRALEVGADSD